MRRPSEREQKLRIGDLARRTGLTVRTLHHYESIGLLAPVRRTPSGHRVYGPKEVRELQRILILRRLGLGLGDIRRCLRDRRFSLRETLRLQLEGLTTQMANLRELSRRLTRVLALVDQGVSVSTEAFLEVMELMTMMEEHYTPEQLEKLRARGEALGENNIRNVEKEWPVLIGKVREEMAKGTDPRTPEIQALARRWRELVEAFTGGDAEITASLGRMYEAEPDVGAGHGLDPEIFRYIGQAMQSPSKAG